MRYRIGEFARLAGTSIKTLRFYDQTGLLEPADVDVRTRYRFYAPEQLRDLAAIRAFRISVPRWKRYAASSDRRVVKSAASCCRDCGTARWRSNPRSEPFAAMDRLRDRERDCAGLAQYP